ncbi:MAG TPA: response regulator [Ktedonobacteraceae bacterium]|nr:response regulator [Ktedonobacteraceae bacterium]
MAKKIWVVDDDESILEVLQIILETAGYDIQTSLNGESLRHLDDQRLPDLILLDILLSGTDGREICKNLKSRESTRHIPVILLSAHSDASKAADGSGANAFLAKPFDVDALIKMVQKQLASS